MWFEDPITEGIYLARVTPQPVLIYVRDNFTASKKIDAYFNNPEVRDLIVDKCVAIRLESSSDEASQFFSISSKAIPSVCVYYDGVQRLKLTDGSITLDKFKASLETALDTSVPFNPPAKNKTNKSINKSKQINIESKLNETNDSQSAVTKSKPVKKPEPKEQSSKSTNNTTTEKFIEYKECKLAIKLPDGTIARESFNAKDTLNQVRVHICQNCEIGTSAFNLVQSFPRRLFTVGEEQLSLIELGLCPNNTIIVQRTDSGDSVFTSPLSYIQSGVDMATGAFNSLFGGWYQSGSDTDANTSTSGNSNQNNRSGNIHTLHSSGDRDPNVTYNGNSTNQQ
ncbi:UBX-domain-containing protein [Conidiobolus coronatus NRRL 28638]|uniref:UBX-domain-containing protein n=1 Tax=Conidiobolus coronatus (strain ATCC 28846 / CBS 209.66 / NRRL 28638) TaxID=796925 RepID=A0A137P798_CONC2|nr:UBX-domain-containing protein [Conidiobolus coronatus NRRL 28638]|eukprot:KXN70801.1 UBX-domain-containing protein [Conidiobolus coronatus NRRL 28638]